MRFGGAKRDRTADLYNAIVALYQLSYDPSLCERNIRGIPLTRQAKILLSRFGCFIFRQLNAFIEFFPNFKLFFTWATHDFKGTTQASIG